MFGPVFVPQRPSPRTERHRSRHEILAHLQHLRRSLRRRRLRAAYLEDRQPRRLGRLRGQGHARSRPAGRRSRPTSWPRSTSAGPACPTRRSQVPEDGVPEWLRRCEPAARRGARRWRPTPARCSTGWPAAGRTGAGSAATSTTEADARAFYDEMCHMLAAPDRRRRTRRSGSTPACTGRTASPAPPQGHYYVDPETGELTAQSTSAYERPAPHACFIQSVTDDLVNEGGIMDLWVREARIFKYGSGTGSNFSAPARRGRAALRRRQVVGPDVFLKIGDRAAGAIKSGGTTRRAAKMVVPRPRPPGHRGVHQLEGGRGAEGRRPGRRLAPAEQAPQRRHQGVPRRDGQARDDARLDPAKQRRAAQGRDPRRAARRASPRATSQRALDFARQGFTDAADRRVRHRLGQRRRTTPSPARTRTTRSASPTTSSTRRRRDGDVGPAHGAAARRRRRPAPKPKPSRAATCGTRSPRRLGVRRPRRPVRHHDQRVAHLPGGRPRSTRATRASEYMFLDDTACNLASLNSSRSSTRPRRSTSKRLPTACRIWTLIARRSAC